MTGVQTCALPIFEGSKPSFILQVEGSKPSFILQVEGSKLSVGFLRQLRPADRPIKLKTIKTLCFETFWQLFWFPLLPSSSVLR